MISVVQRFTKRSRAASARARRHRAIGVALEPLENRILFTWQGAFSGNTFDAAHTYNTLANWSSGVIEDSFVGVTLTGNLTLYVTGAHTTGAGGLNFGYSGNFSITLVSSSTTTETITLGGNIAAAPANQTVTIGDVTNTDDVSLALGAANRTFTTAAGETLDIPNVISGADSLTAAGTGTLTLSGVNTYTGGTTLSSGQLNINNAKAVGTGTLTISGGTIDNTSGAAITLTNNNAGSWGASFTFIGTNNLNLGTGAVALTASPTVTINGGMLTVGGIISGAHSLTEAGAGTLTLSGANTFTGGMTLTAGQLNINNAKAVGAAAGTFTINGGTIDNTSGALVTLSNNNLQTWGGDFTFVGSNALNLGTGAVTLGAARTVTVSASTLTAGGAIGDGGSAFSLTKSGAGELAVTAAGTYTGGTTINAGILSFANGALGTGNITFAANSTLQWNGANTQDISAKIQAIASGVIAIFDTNGNNVTLASALSGQGAITKVGAGALTLSGNSNFSGGANLSVGTLNINSATAIGTGTLTISAGTTLNNTSGGLVTLSNNNAETWAGSFTYTGTDQLNLGTGAVTLGANCTATMSALALIVGGAIGDGGSGFLLTKAGAGTLTLLGNNTFSGGMTLTAGTLDVNSDTAVGSGTFAINGGTIDNTTAGIITLSNNNVLSWGASFTFTGTNALNLGTGALTLGATVTVTASASTLTVGGAIGDGGSGFKITKAGVGTLTLSGNNTFSGGVALTAGQLNINSATAIGSGTFNINGGNFDNTSVGAITLSSNNAITFTQNFTFVGSNALNLGTGAVTMAASRTATITANTLTIGGAIGDGGSGFKVTKAGAGTLTLSGNNTFSGGTTLTLGQLNINSATAVGSGLFTISAGTIDNTSNAAITLSNNNTGSWGGSFTFVGTNNLNLGTGAVTLTGSPTVTITGGMLSDGGIISGNKTLTESGGGTLTLSGVSTFSNGMTLTSGQLNINNAAAIGTSTFTINGGTIDNTSGAAITLSNNNAQSWAGSFTFVGTNNLNLGTGGVTLTGSRTVTINSGMLTVGGIIAGAHTLTEAGSGTLTLSGANTYSTGMTLLSGQLNINNAKAVGTSTFTIDGGTIDNTSGGAITLFNNNVQTWGGDFTFVGSNALNLGTGAVTLGASRTVTVSASTLTEGGIIAGAGFSLTKAGAGVLTLSGANTFTGGTTLSAGQLNINNAKAVGTGTFAINGGTIDNTSGGAFTLFNNNVQTWGGDFTFVGTNALNLGTGTVTLGATRAVTISASTLTVGGAIGDGGNGFGITKAGNGTLLLNAADTFSGTTTISAGVAQLGNANAAQDSTVSIGATNGLTFTAAIGSFTIGGLAGGSNEALTDTAAAAVTLTVGNNGSTNTYSGILSASGAIKVSGGAQTLSGINTFTGGTTLAAGAQLNINNAAAVGTGTFVINGGTIDNTSGGAITLSNNNVQTWGGDFTFAGSNALNLGTGAVTLGANRTVTVSGGTLSEGGNIAGAFSLTKAGAGTLTLSGANTFSTGTTLAAGQLNINSAAAVGTGTFAINGGTIDNTSGGAITLSNNNTQTWGGDFTFVGSNALNFGTGAVTLAANRTVTDSAGTLTEGGIIGGAFSLTKAGGGTLILTGSNTFNGGLTISAGTLLANDAAGSATGSGAVAVNNGGTLAGTGTASGAVTVNSGGTLAPGNGAATSIFNTGNLILASSSTLDIVLNGNTAGSGYDQVNVTGTVNVTGSTLALSGTRSAHDGSLLTIINNDAADAVTGTFTGLAEGGTTIFSSVTYTATYIGGTGNDIVLTADPAATTTAVVSSANPSLSGQSVTFTATISSTSAGTPTGTATFLDGVTTLGMGTLNGSGVATLSTAALSVGSHSITVSYGGDTNFTTSTSSTLTQTVNQSATSSSVASSANPSVSGQSVTFTATVTATAPGVGTPTGSVTFMDGLTSLGTGILNGSGQTTLSTAALSIGSHSITVVYGGDTNFVTSTSSTLTQTVNQSATSSSVASSANPSVSGQSVTFTATVTATAPGSGTPTGTVTFMDGLTTLGAGTLDGSGQTTLSTAALSVAGHSITVVYGGDTNFTTSTSSTLTQTVNQSASSSSVSSSANPSAFGESVTFTATVSATAPGSGTPTGTVTFMDGLTSLGTGTLDGSGQTTLSTSALSVGDHSITVVYGGDTNFVTSTSSTLTQTVNQSASSSSVSSSANPSAFGESVTFTATISATAPGSGTPTGTVTFMDGLTSLGTGTLNGSGQTTLSTSALAVGDHSITVVYGGDTNFTTSTSSTLTQTVNQSASSSSVASSANPSAFGESVTFTATVSATAPGAGTPTGTVTFMDGLTSLGTGTLNGSGQTTLSTSALTVGSHSITVVYGGDTDFTTSTSSTLPQTVNQSATSSSVASSANPSVSGQSVTFTATVTATAPGVGTPTGTVTFMDGLTTLGTGTLNGSGQTTLSTTALSVGSHSITVVYAGDTNFVASTSSTLTQTVNQSATSSSVASSANPSVFGQSVTFTATVTATAPGAGTPTGTVTFMDGLTSLGTGTLDGSGQTTLSTSALSVGGHSVKVVYGGDTDFTTSTSSTLTQTVNQAATSSSVSSSANPSTFGESVTFTATVSATAPGAGTPTGTVTFMDGLTSLGTGTLNGSGQATLSTSALVAGIHSITVVYAGDTDFVTSTSSALSQTVNQSATTSSVSSSANPSTFGQSVTLTATIGAVAPGAGIPTGSVEFMDGLTLLGTTTLDGSGQATFSTSALPVGSDSITVTYVGDANFSTSTSSSLSQTVNQSATTSSVASSANPSVFGQNVTLTATIAAVAPGAGVPTGTVTFMDGLTSLGTGTLNGSGHATLSTSALSVGSHSITVVYAGDSDFTTSTSSTLTQTVNQSATTSSVSSSANPSVVGQSITFTATIAAAAPGSGTPTGSVTFKDGSTVLGTNALNGSGVATFSISSLALGSHSITAVYAGDANFTTSTSSILTQTVNQDSTIAAVVASANPGTFSQSVTFTATVTASAPGSGTPTGLVTFMDGLATLGLGTLDGSGHATFTTSSLGLGSHSITVVYVGDSNFAGGISAALNEGVAQFPPSMLAFGQQPTGAIAGIAISPAVTVDVEDPFGNIVGVDSSDVTLAVASGAGSLLGTVTVAAINGVATFSNLSLDLAGPYTLSAADGLLAGTTSNSFTITPAAAAKLAFVQQPASATAGMTISPAVTVGVEDAFGNAVTTDNSDVTLSVATGPGALAGTLTVAAINGVATFGDLSLNAAGSYALSAADGSLGTATSGTFAVAANTPASLVITQQPTTLTAGSNPSSALVIQIKDQNGNVITAFNSPVTLSIVSGPSGGVIAGTPTVTAVNGVATFSNVHINHAGTYVLAASINGGIVAETAPIQIDPGPVVQNVVMQQPAPSWQFGAISPNVVINLTDQYGNPVAAAGGSVTAALSSGPVGATLSGTLTAPVVAGQATFGNLSVNLPGMYTLVFTSSGNSPAVTESFAVVSIPAQRFLFNGSPISSRSILMQQHRNAPIYFNLGPPVFMDDPAPPNPMNFIAAPAVNITPQSFLNAIDALSPSLLREFLDSI